MTLQGVDYSESRPSPAELKANGLAFVARYLSGARAPGNAGKDIGPTERDALHAAGLAIVLVWETDGRTGPLNGASGGNADGVAAVAEAQWLGAPAGTCLYFAVDFEALSGNAAALEAYARSVTAACHAAGYRSGIYGGLATEQYTRGLVDLLWQTYAWSGGQWHPSAVLRQYQNGESVAGGSVDLDEATTGDYGQWSAAGAPSPASGIATLGSNRMLATRPDNSCADAFVKGKSDDLLYTFAVKPDGTNTDPYAIDPGHQISGVLGAAWVGGVCVVMCLGTDSIVYVARYAGGAWSEFGALTDYGSPLQAAA